LEFTTKSWFDLVGKFLPLPPLGLGLVESGGHSYHPCGTPVFDFGMNWRSVGDVLCMIWVCVGDDFGICWIQGEGGDHSSRFLLGAFCVGIDKFLNLGFGCVS
jgi:hypothetical protein